MSVPTQAQLLLERLDGTRPNNTEIRTIAKEVGKSSELAAHLWKNGGFSARMLSLLILELKAVDVPRIEMLISDLEAADGKEQSQLLDWMIANVIMKKAALKNETAKWRDDPSTLKQRVFWSVHARSIRAENHGLNEHLLQHIERELAGANEKVQWNMNWCGADRHRGRTSAQPVHRAGGEAGTLQGLSRLQGVHLPLSPDLDRERRGKEGASMK